MDFSQTQDQHELRELARRILSDQTENAHLREVEKQADRFDEKLWADLAEAGLLGVAIDEAYGGMQLGFESLCLLIEEVGAHVAPIPALSTLVSAALPIGKFGTDEQKSRLLPGIASGDRLVTAALAEPEGTRSEAPHTQAKSVAGGFSLNGGKTCVPFANRAQRILLAAQLDGATAVFLLDPNVEGVVLTRQQTTAGEPQFEIDLCDARVAAEDLLADAPTGEAAMRFCRMRSMAALCAMAVGLTERAMRMTAAYTAEREQFGVKIATFQAVGQRAADCYIDVECLRVVTQQAISLLESGEEPEEEIRVAKIWAGDVTHRVSHAAQHLHGGIGVDRDYPLFRYCLWAKQIELTLGSSAELIAELGEDIHREYRSA